VAFLFWPFLLVIGMGGSQPATTRPLPPQAEGFSYSYVE
jgi:hypothetical protein